MKKRISAAAILLVALVALVAYLAHHQSPNPAENPAPPAAAAQTNNPAVTSNNPPAGVAAISTPASLADRAGELPPAAPVATNIPPLIILQNAHQAIAQYAQVYGGNPVGTNPEITAALTGQNPRHINFISPEAGLQINDQGEMLDAWGTPIFFHQLSAHDMEIRSAGPDRRMWTLDDLLIH